MDSYALGRYLRDTRESLELPLDDAEAKLKIRRKILEAFEEGDFEVADISQVQVRGFLRNYARYLKLDEDRILLYYDAALQEAGKRGRKSRGRNGDRPASRSQRDTGERKPPSKSSRPDSRSKRKPRTQSRRRMSVERAVEEQRSQTWNDDTLHTDTDPAPLIPTRRAITDTDPSPLKIELADPDAPNPLVRIAINVAVALSALAALVIIVFVTIQLLEEQQREDFAPGDAILGQLPPTATRTLAPTFTPRAGGPTLPAVQQEFDGRGVAVTIEMQQRGYLRVFTDGNTQIDRLAVPGEVFDYRAQNEIVLVSSNAESLNIVYNGQQQGSFGGRGQAVDVIFTETGIDIESGPGFEPTPETPTATITPDARAATVIAAQTPSNTPGPSPTPTNRPSITPTPSISPTPSDTPTITPTPTITLTPTPTVVLPPREPARNPTPTKDGA